MSLVSGVNPFARVYHRDPRLPSPVGVLPSRFTHNEFDLSFHCHLLAAWIMSVQNYCDDDGPTGDKRCFDCFWLVGYVSWWCTNDEAIEQRGTSIPGVHSCSFWKCAPKRLREAKRVSQTLFRIALVCSWVALLAAVIILLFSIYGGPTP